MENQFVPGSNTLDNIARLATGFMLDIKILPLENGDASFAIKPTPLKAGAEVKALPTLQGIVKAGQSIDEIVTSDIYELFQSDGGLADQTHRLAAFQKSLAKEEKAITDKRSPEGRAAMEADKAKVSGTTVTSSTGTGKNAPKKPAPATPAAIPTPDLFAAPATPAEVPLPADGLVQEATVIEEPAAPGASPFGF